MSCWTSHPSTSAGSNDIKHAQAHSRTLTQVHTHRVKSREFKTLSQFPHRERDRERDFIWVCLKSQPCIWPLPLYAEFEEKKEIRGTQKKKIFLQKDESILVRGFNQRLWILGYKLNTTREDPLNTYKHMQSILI